MLLGVDVGGTFTDAVLVDGDRVLSAKSPTTPDDQSRGVLAAIDAVLRAAGREPGEVESFAHGMTVATNALLQGEGARTVFAATAGFTDIIELGRQARPHLYKLCEATPDPLAPPEMRVAVQERCVPDGVVGALDDAGAVATQIASLQPEAVAVCLLHSYAHPEHERALGQALAKTLPGVHVSLSHEVTATFREYERAATTEIDASLSPLLATYLNRLRTESERAGLPEPEIMQSSGGLARLDRAAAHAAHTVLSGPAGGAAAASLLADRLGEPGLLCFDMGGTSCDVSVVRDGLIEKSAGREVGGRPIALPMVDIHTVGAGGGSIAWADPGGALRVGPRSAGAEPGPACYGRGGSEPTVTDANAVLDRIPPVLGDIELDSDAAHAAVAGLAERLGLEVRECAAGIVRVADAEMVRALRVMTVERGLDPRDFALLAFGGAGPVHACAIAEQLGITRIVVPHEAGVLSALGLAAADRRWDEAHTVMLEDFADEDLRRLGGADEVVWEARYRGQAHELALRDVEPRADAVREALHAEHKRRYGYRDDGASVQLVTVRGARVHAGPAIEFSAPAGESAEGPATIELPGCTLFVAEGWDANDDGIAWRLRWTR